MTGRLILGGAPLGQSGDASPRLRRAMAEADVLAVEDTRRLHRLAQDLEVTLTGRVVTFHESVERSRLPGLVAAMADGATVLLLTDAGMPSVSDPGYTLVRAAIEAGVEVTSVPGPSAVVTALAVSGLPCDRFCFEGFLPRRAGERRARLAALAQEPRTTVLFEAPHRLADTLADAVAVLGADRPAAVCRELTKTHEEVRRERWPSWPPGWPAGSAGRSRWSWVGRPRGRRRWTPRSSPSWSRPRRRAVPAAGTPSVRWPRAPACRAGRSTTPSSPPGTRDPPEWSLVGVSAGSKTPASDRRCQRSSNTVSRSRISAG